MLTASAIRNYGWRMNEAIAFDTHRFVKRLTENGFTEKQAETLVEAHGAMLDANQATKADLAKVETNLLKWLISAAIVQAGLIVALVNLL